MLELRVLLSDASSIFAPPVRAYTAAYQNVSPDPVDLNGDGKNDLVITDSSASGAKVMVLLNNGSGGFGAPTQVWSGTAVPSVQEVDLNGDGKPDLIIDTSGTAGPTGVVDILINSGTGTFGAPAHVYTGGNMLSVEAIDLNGDNRPDLIIEDMSNLPTTNSKIVVTLNSGTGSFGAGTQIWMGGRPGTGAMIGSRSCRAGCGITYSLSHRSARPGIGPHGCGPGLAGSTRNPPVSRDNRRSLR
jgi:hypothetical protein